MNEYSLAKVQLVILSVSLELTVKERVLKSMFSMIVHILVASSFVN